MPGKIGVSYDWRGANLAGIVRIAKTADELGYESFWIPEAWGGECFSTAAYVLSNTRNIRVCTGVVNSYSRSAALIGMGCVSLLQIAPERFSLGLGTSGRGLVENWHGTRFLEPLTRLREYVEIIKKVVGGEVVNYDGKITKLSRFRIFTDVPESRSFKIYLAALGEKSIRLAGEVSDGAIVIFYSLDRLKSASALLNSSSSGKELVAIIPTEVTSGSTEERAMLSMKKRIAFYASSMGEYYARTLADSGFGETVEAIRKAYSSGRRQQATELVPSDLVHELCLVGNAGHIRRKLNEIGQNCTPVIGVRASSEQEILESENSLRALAS